MTVRSETGRRARVVLDGAQSRHGELFGITGCKGVTVADLTIQNVRFNGFKINSDLFTTGSDAEPTGKGEPLPMAPQRATLEVQVN